MQSTVAIFAALNESRAPLAPSALVHPAAIVLKTLPPISHEQSQIIQQLMDNKNVVVDSVAGSGKTTSNLHIAKHFNTDTILLLTYNSKLKLETRVKAHAFGATNIEVHSYHSFCVKYYDNQCFTDSEIAKIVNQNKLPSRAFMYTLIVLDEAQDITQLYYELVCKIFKDNNSVLSPKMCIFGDKQQSIFDFNGADQRFIEYATTLYQFNPLHCWTTCNLSVSFRITHEMSLFINKCLLKTDRIVSRKVSNVKPRYIICDCFGGDDAIDFGYGFGREASISRPFEEVKYYLGLGYLPEEIFILAPSVKNPLSPVRKLENKIKRELPGVMVHVPTSDDEKLDEELIQHKLLFSTFHQTKGLERKVVIVFNFDTSYFEFFKKEANPCIFPNEMYVAVTRGIEQLTLLHHHQHDYFHFADKSLIPIYCHFENASKKKPHSKQKPLETAVTDVLKHLPQQIIDECFDELTVTSAQLEPIEMLDVSIKVKFLHTTESVSNIIGIAIPNMFEMILNDKMGIFQTLRETNFEHNTIDNGCWRSKHIKPKNNKPYNINNIDIHQVTASELMYIATCWDTHKTQFLFKLYQITDYDWFKQENLDKCIERMHTLNISKHSVFAKSTGTFESAIDWIHRLCRQNQ